MKILSWNINGIRASKVDLKKLFDSLDADVICLQETKVTRKNNQGPVNLDYVVWNIKGSMSCTDIPFNDSSVIIIYHLLAISNGLITCLVSVLYYHLPGPV